MSHHPNAKFLAGTFEKSIQPWEHALQDVKYAREIIEAHEQNSGVGQGKKFTGKERSLIGLIGTLDHVQEVVDLHESYTAGGVSSVGNKQKQLEDEGEAEAMRDLQEIRDEVEKTSSTNKKRSRRRSTGIANRSKRRINRKQGAMRSEERKAEQSHLLRNYYHEVEIATARVDTVLNKLNAPPKAAESELTRMIDSWQAELELDDHPDVIPVRFGEPGDKKKVSHLELELDMLQDDIEAEARTEQVKSVYYWSLKKKERYEIEEKLLYSFDKDNAAVAQLLDDSEATVDLLSNENNKLFVDIEEGFMTKLRHRKNEWLKSLREKVAFVKEAKRIEAEEREERFNAVKEECNKYQEKIAALDAEIMASGINSGMDSASYIALTKKHEQKEAHLIEIIDRQQARISTQGKKVGELEDEEEELQNYLDELEASVHMSAENPDIIGKTIHEVMVARKRSMAKRQRKSGMDGGDGSGRRSSRMSTFVAANAAAMGLRRRTTSRRTTMINIDNTNKELKMENKRLATSLTDMVRKEGIEKKDEQLLKQRISSLKGICDENLEAEEKMGGLQNDIDDMDSLLYKFNAAKTIGGKVDLGDLTGGGDHSFVSLSSKEEKMHGKLKKLQNTYEEDVKRLWEEVDKGANDSGLVGLWSRSRDIEMKSLSELASLRLQIQKTPKRVFTPKGDYITNLLKKHTVPSLKDISAFQTVCILNMVLAAMEAGCKVERGLEEALEECIGDGKRPPKNLTDKAYSAVTSAVMIVGAPKTFRLGDVSHVKNQLENATLAFRAADMLHRLRCCLEILKMARSGGLKMEDAKWCGDRLVRSAIAGSKPEMKVFRILHAATLVASVNYAKVGGIKVNKDVEKGCKQLMLNKFETGAGIDLVAQTSWVIGRLVLSEIGQAKGESVFGTKMAQEVLRKCTENGEPMGSSNFKLVHAILDDLNIGWEGGERDGGGLGVLQGAFSAAERYVNEECIENTLLVAEKSVGLNEEESENGEQEEEVDGEDGEDEREEEEEEEEEEDGTYDAEEWEERKRLKARLKRWRAAGFNALYIQGVESNRFKKLMRATELIKKGKRPRGQGGGKVPSKKGAAIKRLTAATMFAKGNKTLTSSKTLGIEAKKPEQRTNFTLRLGQTKEPEVGVVKNEKNEGILWDSTATLETKKKMKRWVEDAMETDSLMSDKLKNVWPKVEVLICRKEEDYIDRELRKINLEIPFIVGLHKEITDRFGENLDGGGEAEADKDFWDRKIEMPVKTHKLDGSLNRNELSLALLTVQKEGQSLSRQLLPAHKKRKSTLGFVNSMMFTKRIGMAWKNATQAKIGGGGEMDALQKVVEELAKKKQKLEIEVSRLRDRERNVLLTRQQMEIRQLEAANDEVKLKLAEDGKEHENEGEKTMFEKLKDEQTIVRKLREEVRKLKDEQHEMEEKLKLVRIGKVSAGEALMTEADRGEMEKSLKKLKKTIRMFQRAIKRCRDQWEELKKAGKIPETSGAKKLRAALLQKKALATMGLGKRLSGLVLSLQGQRREIGGGAGGVETGQGAAAVTTPKFRVLQFAFGFGGGGGGGGGGEGGGGGRRGDGGSAAEEGKNAKGSKGGIASRFKNALMSAASGGKEGRKTPREKNKLFSKSIRDVLQRKSEKTKTIGLGI